MTWPLSQIQETGLVNYAANLASAIHRTFPELDESISDQIAKWALSLMFEPMPSATKH